MKNIYRIIFSFSSLFSFILVYFSQNIYNTLFLFYTGFLFIIVFCFSFVSKKLSFIEIKHKVEELKGEYILLKRWYTNRMNIIVQDDIKKKTVIFNESK